MAITIVNNGLNQEKGVSYSAITDSSVDWTGITNNTYFYDKATDLPYYKNSSGTVISLFESGGGGGNTLYSADDTIGSGRIATLTDTLTLLGATNQDGLIIDFTSSSTTSYSKKGFKLTSKDGYESSWNSRTGSWIFRGNNPLTVQGNSTTDDVFQVAWNGGGLWKGGTITLGENAFGKTEMLEGGEIRITDITGVGIQHYIPRGANNQIAYFYGQGFSGLAGFLIGGTTKIGTEDISLQGPTLVNDKFEIQTTTEGMLMPRLTTAQMNAISSPDTHLLVFNTDLNALYRYNGSAWVAMAAGYGIVSTTDSVGNPTFYATVKAAYDAGAGSIKLHTDYEETTSNPINIVDGRNIDLNGFTYSYNVADGTSIFEDTTSNNSIRITNGRLIRKNGTGGDYVINCNLIQTKMDLINIYAENENGACLNVRTTFNGSGSEFASNNTSGNGFYFGTGSIVLFGKYVNKSNGGSNFTGSELKFVEFICQGSGLNQLAGNVFNSRFIGNTGRAVLTGSNTKIYDCYLESPSNNALDLRNNSEVYNSTMVSDAAVCVNTVGTTATKMKGCIIQGSHSVYSVNALSLIEDCIIVNSGAGQAINVNASNVEIVNNVIRLESGTADGIYINSTRLNTLVSGNKIFVNDPTATGIVSANVDIYIVDNKIKGTTLGVNLGTGTNLWTATTDAQGNSVQL
jgi:hypothetical protein